MVNLFLKENLHCEFLAKMPAIRATLACLGHLGLRGTTRKEPIGGHGK
jgi:hypothetical protein